MARALEKNLSLDERLAQLQGKLEDISGELWKTSDELRKTTEDIKSSYLKAFSGDSPRGAAQNDTIQEYLHKLSDEIRALSDQIAQYRSRPDQSQEFLKLNEIPAKLENVLGVVYKIGESISKQQNLFVNLKNAVADLDKQFASEKEVRLKIVSQLDHLSQQVEVRGSALTALSNLEDKSEEMIHHIQGFGKIINDLAAAVKSNSREDQAKILSQLHDLNQQVELWRSAIADISAMKNYSQEMIRRVQGFDQGMAEIKKAIATDNREELSIIVSELRDLGGQVKKWEPAVTELSTVRDRAEEMIHRAQEFDQKFDEIKRAIKPGNLLFDLGAIFSAVDQLFMDAYIRPHQDRLRNLKKEALQKMEARIAGTGSGDVHAFLEHCRKVMEALDRCCGRHEPEKELSRIYNKIETGIQGIIAGKLSSVAEIEWQENEMPGFLPFFADLCWHNEDGLGLLELLQSAFARLDKAYKQKRLQLKQICNTLETASVAPFDPWQEKPMQKLVKNEFLVFIDAVDQMLKTCSPPPEERRAINSNLSELFKIAGLEEIPIEIGKTEANPNICDIQNVVPSDKPKGTVAEIVRRGFIYQSDIIKKASVVESG